MKQIFKQQLLKKLIINKAYKGYVYWNKQEDENAEYLSFKEFSNFELWKIKFSFQIYLERVKGVKSLGFNPSDKTLLTNLLKTI